IQKANFRCNNIIYMYSTKGGTGKSFFVEILEQLTEPYFRLIVDTENMIKWSANISRKTLVCINEHPNNVENSNYIEHLKSLSTDNKIETRQKHKVDQVEDNCVNFIILSNYLNGVIMTDDALLRRFTFYNVCTQLQKKINLEIRLYILLFS